jgi:hypothetical protein
MVNVVIEFDDQNNDKLFRFIIKNQPDDCIWLEKGDEIGFDLVESKEFFYVIVSRKAYLVGQTCPFYIICRPQCFINADAALVVLEKFKAQFGDDLVLDP